MKKVNWITLLACMFVLGACSGKNNTDKTTAQGVSAAAKTCDAKAISSSGEAADFASLNCSELQTLKYKVGTSCKTSNGVTYLRVFDEQACQLGWRDTAPGGVTWYDGLQDGYSGYFSKLEEFCTAQGLRLPTLIDAETAHAHHFHEVFNARREYDGYKKTGFYSDAYSHGLKQGFWPSASGLYCATSTTNPNNSEEKFTFYLAHASTKKVGPPMFPSFRTANEPWLAGYGHKVYGYSLIAICVK